jgi:hypothetical protein
MGNSTSHEPSAPVTIASARPDLQFLINLPADEKAWVLAALGNDPLKKARTILSSSNLVKPGSLLTSQELARAVDDVLDSFRSKAAVDEDYIINLIEGIVEGVRKEGGVNEAMEQMVSLAARMVKGERCGECGSLDYHSPIRGSIDLTDEYVDALADLVNIASEQGTDVVLSAKARFSIDKLVTIYDEYHWLQNLFKMDFETDDLEEMWCHKSQSCWCWEFGGRSDEHSEKCGLHAHHENSQDWYEYDDDYE